MPENARWLALRLLRLKITLYQIPLGKRKYFGIYFLKVKVGGDWNIKIGSFDHRALHQCCEYLEKRLQLNEIQINNPGKVIINRTDEVNIHRKEPDMSFLDDIDRNVDTVTINTRSTMLQNTLRPRRTRDLLKGIPEFRPKAKDSRTLPIINLKAYLNSQNPVSSHRRPGFLFGT